MSVLHGWHAWTAGKPWPAILQAMTSSISAACLQEHGIVSSENAACFSCVRCCWHAQVDDSVAVVQELLRLAPTILLIAGYVWFTRRQMGGLGGTGGPGGRGLFNVGKAQVSTYPMHLCARSS